MKELQMQGGPRWPPLAVRATTVGTKGRATQVVTLDRHGKSSTIFEFRWGAKPGDGYTDSRSKLVEERRRAGAQRQQEDHVSAHNWCWLRA